MWGEAFLHVCCAPYTWLVSRWLCAARQPRAPIGTQWPAQAGGCAPPEDSQAGGSAPPQEAGGNAPPSARSLLCHQETTPGPQLTPRSQRKLPKEVQVLSMGVVIANDTVRRCETAKRLQEIGQAKGRGRGLGPEINEGLIRTLMVEADWLRPRDSLVIFDCRMFSDLALPGDGVCTCQGTSPSGSLARVVGDHH